VVATVATDGGENRLSLEPMQLQVVRVADSLGEIYFEDFIAQSLTPEEILRFFFQSNERLQRFIKYLELDWDELPLAAHSGRHPYRAPGVPLGETPRRHSATGCPALAHHRL
jgi:hypothetical protein